MQGAMGADVFLTAHNGERRARAAAKERRAKQVAQEAVVNPAAATARRSRKAQAKKRHVAKRMDMVKVLRRRWWEGLEAGEGGERGVRGVDVWRGVQCMCGSGGALKWW